MDTEEVMFELDLSDEEYDAAYTAMLTLIRNHGTHGVETMLRHVEAELAAGNESL